MNAMKPDLKIIDHPDKDKPNNMQVVDFGWAKVTIETEAALSLGNSVYILEITKLHLMGR